MGIGEISEVTFRPSRVDGLDGIELVRVHRDRVEFLAGTESHVFHYADFYQPQSRVWRNGRGEPRFAARLWRWVVARWSSRFVADRDWFHEPQDMYFVWFTKPEIKMFMPLDESKELTDVSHFRQIKEVLRQGGYYTYDLG